MNKRKRPPKLFSIPTVIVAGVLVFILVPFIFKAGGIALASYFCSYNGRAISQWHEGFLGSGYEELNWTRCGSDEECSCSTDSYEDIPKYIYSAKSEAGKNQGGVEDFASPYLNAPVATDKNLCKCEKVYCEDNEGKLTVELGAFKCERIPTNYIYICQRDGTYLPAKCPGNAVCNPNGKDYRDNCISPMAQDQTKLQGAYSQPVKYPSTIPQNKSDREIWINDLKSKGYGKEEANIELINAGYEPLTDADNYPQIGSLNGNQISFVSYGKYLVTGPDGTTVQVAARNPTEAAANAKDLWEQTKKNQIAQANQLANGGCVENEKKCDGPAMLAVCVGGKWIPAATCKGNCVDKAGNIGAHCPDAQNTPALAMNSDTASQAPAQTPQQAAPAIKTCPDGDCGACTPFCAPNGLVSCKDGETTPRLTPCDCDPSTNTCKKEVHSIPCFNKGAVSCVNTTTSVFICEDDSTADNSTNKSWKLSEFCPADSPCGDVCDKQGSIIGAKCGSTCASQNKKTAVAGNNTSDNAGGVDQQGCVQRCYSGSDHTATVALSCPNEEMKTVKTCSGGECNDDQTDCADSAAGQDNSSQEAAKNKADQAAENSKTDAASQTVVDACVNPGGAKGSYTCSGPGKISQCQINPAAINRSVSSPSANLYEWHEYDCQKLTVADAKKVCDACASKPAAAPAASTSTSDCTDPSGPRNGYACLDQLGRVGQCQIDSANPKSSKWHPYNCKTAQGPALAFCKEKNNNNCGLGPILTTMSAKTACKDGELRCDPNSAGYFDNCIAVDAGRQFSNSGLCAAPGNRDDIKDINKFCAANNMCSGTVKTNKPAGACTGPDLVGHKCFDCVNGSWKPKACCPCDQSKVGDCGTGVSTANYWRKCAVTAYNGKQQSCLGEDKKQTCDKNGICKELGCNWDGVPAAASAKGCQSCYNPGQVTCGIKSDNTNNPGYLQVCQKNDYCLSQGFQCGLDAGQKQQLADLFKNDNASLEVFDKPQYQSQDLDPSVKAQRKIFETQIIDNIINSKNQDILRLLCQNFNYAATSCNCDPELNPAYNNIKCTDVLSEAPAASLANKIGDCLPCSPGQDGKTSYGCGGDLTKKQADGLYGYKICKANPADSAKTYAPSGCWGNAQPCKPGAASACDQLCKIPAKGDLPVIQWDGK